MARLARARILTHLAYLQYGRWDNAGALRSMADGLAAIGKPAPRNFVALLVSSVLSFVAGLVCGLTKVGYATPSAFTAMFRKELGVSPRRYFAA